MERMFLAMVCMLGIAAATRGEDQDANYLKCVDSVVWVVITDAEMKSHLAYGSGVVIDAGRGEILTAHHVVVGRVPWVVFPAHDSEGEIISSKEFYIDHAAEYYAMCEIVASDPKRDLCLLRLKLPRPGLKAMPLASRASRPGQSIYTIGNAGDGLFGFAGGSVRKIFDDSFKFASGQEVTAKVVEMTVPINPGDSGGPIIHNGELIGINCCSRDKEQLVHRGIHLTEIYSFLIASYHAESTKGEVTKSSRSGPPPEPGR